MIRAIENIKIPDECSESDKAWWRYWKDLSSVAGHVFVGFREHSYAFEVIKENGKLLHARIMILCAIDELSSKERIDEGTAADVYKLLAFSDNEKMGIRQSEYAIGSGAISEGSVQ